MMFPNNPASAPPKPTPSPIYAAPVDVDDDCMAHADYNLQPLAVHSLEHYVHVIRDDEGERFHVS